MVFNKAEISTPRATCIQQTRLNVLNYIYRYILIPITASKSENPVSIINVWGGGGFRSAEALEIVYVFCNTKPPRSSLVLLFNIMSITFKFPLQPNNTIEKNGILGLTRKMSLSLKSRGLPSEGSPCRPLDEEKGQLLYSGRGDRYQGIQGRVDSWSSRITENPTQNHTDRNKPSWPAAPRNPEP